MNPEGRSHLVAHEFALGGLEDRLGIISVACLHALPARDGLQI